jgi:hypothetical protein
MQLPLSGTSIGASRSLRDLLVNSSARSPNCRSTTTLASRRSWDPKILTPSISLCSRLPRTSLDNPSAGRSPRASAAGLLEERR